MSIVPLLNLFGTIHGYPAAEYFGRKPTLMATNVMKILGFTIIYFSNNFALLMLARSLTCFALGFGVIVPFVLISDITTIKQRAPLVSHQHPVHLLQHPCLLLFCLPFPDQLYHLLHCWGFSFVLDTVCLPT